MQKITQLLLILFTLRPCVALSQTDSSSTTSSDTLKQWYLNNPENKKHNGIALAEAYAILPSAISPSTVIVAVIDGGTDSAHADLKANLWTNTNEIPNNGIDDDHNGYIDDVHGWNFIGGKSGDVFHDNDEITRLYKLKKSDLPAEYSFRKIHRSYRKEFNAASSNLYLLSRIKKMTEEISKNSATSPVKVEAVSAYHAHGFFSKRYKKIIVSAMKQDVTFETLKSEIDDEFIQLENSIKFNLNPKYDVRNIVGDDYKNLKDHNYGNNNITGPNADHGTHVAGIIGAVRNNNFGINGIAAAVKLMIVRVVPDGDERDKDVANAIRYAVDNGAKIINMSFGKSKSPNQQEVDEAVKYAVCSLCVKGAFC